MIKKIIPQLIDFNRKCKVRRATKEEKRFYKELLKTQKSVKSLHGLNPSRSILDFPKTKK